MHSHTTIIRMGSAAAAYKVISKVTVSVTPYPLFSFNGTRNRNEILLNLSMKCWNSALNAEGKVRD
jgi:hypothetical protein